MTAPDIQAVQDMLRNAFDEAALAELSRHDVVQESAEGWTFTVPLMRRWVARQDADPMGRHRG